MLRLEDQAPVAPLCQVSQQGAVGQTGNGRCATHVAMDTYNTRQATGVGAEKKASSETKRGKKQLKLIFFDRKRMN